MSRVVITWVTQNYIERDIITYAPYGQLGPQSGLKQELHADLQRVIYHPTTMSISLIGTN